MPLSASLDLKKEDLRGRGAGETLKPLNLKRNPNGYSLGKPRQGDNKGISVIKEQNEEPEEDFEELEKKHLEFLTVIERMHFK